MNYQKDKLRKQFHLQYIKTNKISTDKFNQGGERLLH